MIKVALLAPFEEPVPPKTYGGTERVVFNLADELVKMGHDVTVFASGDSRPAGKLVACTPRAIRVLPEAKNPQLRSALNMKALSKAVGLINRGQFDIVYNNFGWQLFLFKDLINCPIVTTLHGLLDRSLKPHNFFETEYKMFNSFARENYVSISFNQRKYAPKLKYIATIYHGLDESKFSYKTKPDDYLAFLGRIHPQKGPEYAIKIARKSGHRLIMAAKIDPDDTDYFQKKVRPLIDGKQIQFIGEVNHSQKVRLLKNAKAMLSPIQWDEPFGITNIEALACGTPVIAISRGSLPEIIEDGKTGFLCRTVDQMISRVKDLPKIDRYTCRLEFERRFAARHMAEGYINAYKKIIKYK